MSDWDPEQYWGAGEGDDYREYHVGKLAAHARKRLKPVSLPVKDLKHNLVGDEKMSADEPLWSRAFRKRSKKTHLRHPIMVQRGPEGKHWIIDGAHRLGKAIVKGHKEISAYVFPHDEMPASARVEDVLCRTPLVLESKKLAFRGGIHNRHTPRERAWLPTHLRAAHHEAPRRQATEPKRGRAGDPLRDEPLRVGLEAKAKENRRRLKKKAAKHQFSDVDLSRTELLLDHDKST